MIKFIQCVKRKPELDIVEFRACWRRYTAAVRILAETVGARRCSESTTLAVEANLDVMVSRGTAEPFDALVELWVDSASQVAERLASEEGRRALGDLQRLQEEFIDLGSSSFFFTSDEVLFEGP